VDYDYVVKLQKTKTFNLNKMYDDPKAAQQVIQVLNSQLKKRMGKLPGMVEFNKSSKFYDVNN
jgi:hypothetical protein